MQGAGLFGKVPQTGDFVARGIEPKLRRSLDRWVTAHLAARHIGWPKGGVRGLIDLEGALFLFLAVASRDKIGRRYPLLAVAYGAGVSLENAEVWCDVALPIICAAARGDGLLDPTFQALQSLSIEADAKLDGLPALWLAHQEPLACDAETLDRFFSSD